MTPFRPTMTSGNEQRPARQRENAVEMAITIVALADGEFLPSAAAVARCDREPEHAGGDAAGRVLQPDRQQRDVGPGRINLCPGLAAIGGVQHRAAVTYGPTQPGVDERHRRQRSARRHRARLSPGFAVVVGEDDHAVVTDTNALITLGSDDEFDFYTPCNFDILGLTVDERSLESYGSRIEHCDVSVLFGAKPVLTADPVRIDEFRRLLLSILRSVEANPAALQFPQTQRLLEQSVMAAILNVLSDPGEASVPDAVCPSRRQIVERAKAYMVSHIDQPITVADLCVQLGVSRRTLQYSFQEVLGMNALRLLRAMRLNGVRRDLKAIKPATDSVQDVAAKWGFWHLGHFVTDYKRMFGELPSHTLRGGRRVAPAWPI